MPCSCLGSDEFLQISNCILRAETLGLRKEQGDGTGKNKSANRDLFFKQGFTNPDQHNVKLLNDPATSHPAQLGSLNVVEHLFVGDVVLNYYCAFTLSGLVIGWHGTVATERTFLLCS